MSNPRPPRPINYPEYKFVLPSKYEFCDPPPGRRGPLWDWCPWCGADLAWYTTAKEHGTREQRMPPGTPPKKIRYSVCCPCRWNSDAPHPFLPAEKGGPSSMETIPSRYRQWRLADYPEAAAREIRRFFDDPAVWCCYIHGGPGTKKSSLAAASLVNFRAKYGRTAGHFVTMPEFISICRRVSDNRVKVAEWQESPLLVLDDLGSHRATPHVVESILLLLSRRYEESLKTMITTNLSPDDLGKAFDARIASRLADGIKIDVGESDAREQAEMQRALYD